MIRQRNDPFKKIFERMNRMFDEVPQDEFGFSDVSLPVDVQETDDEIVVRADMPGVNKDNITAKVRDSTLYLAGEGNREVKEEGKDYIRQERSSKSFSRRINLPSDVDGSSAEATYENGVLTVRLKKQEQSQGFDVDIE